MRKKRSWEVKTSQIRSHLIQRGTKWEFTFTLWRVWGQAFKGADSSPVLLQFKVSYHLASSLCPSLPWGSSACPPRLCGCVPVCLSFPFCLGNRLISQDSALAPHPLGSHIAASPAHTSLWTWPCCSFVPLSSTQKFITKPSRFLLVFTFMPLFSPKLSAFSGSTVSSASSHGLDWFLEMSRCPTSITS